MTQPSDTAYLAFSGNTRVAAGPLCEVAAAVREALDADPAACVLVFDAATGRQTDLDVRGTPDEVRARYAPAPAEPRSPGRPRLGVVPREVTLLPRHWEWLATQPGGASVTLRKLVETARLKSADADLARAAQDAAYRFSNAMAGNEAGFEDAIRALYADDHERFDALTETWPADVRDQARELAAPAFSAGAE